MVYEILLRRRSIREFKDKPVEKAKIDRLLKSALLAPSSRNIRPWTFVAVDDAALIEKLSRAKPHGAAFLKGAPLAIAVLGDRSRSDVWVEDTSIASAILLIMAEELGLGACWCQIRKRRFSKEVTAATYVRRLLNAPSQYEVESIIGIGYAALARPPYDDEALQFDKLYHNTFGTGYAMD